MENNKQIAKFFNAEGEETTANQAYKDAQARGYKKTFKEFMDEYGNKGYLAGAIDFLKKVTGNDSTPTQPIGGQITPTPSKTTIMGMSPLVAGIVGIAVAGLLGFGIYKLVKK